MIDTATHRLTRKVSVGQNPKWLAMKTDDTFAYVINQASNDVSVIDLARLRVVSTIPVGKQPYHVAIRPQAVPFPG